MLITKFNKMIKNKIVWGLFAIIISVAMALTFGPGGCEPQKGQGRNSQGILFDEEVSSREFSLARYFEMGEKETSLSREDEVLLRKKAWRRIAVLKKAELIGVEVSDVELAEAIRRDPAFIVNGAFNPERYRQVLTSVYRMKNAEQFYEERMRQELTLGKILNTMGTFIWTPPLEVKRRLSGLVDTFIAEYSILDAKEHTPKVKVSDDDVIAFFDINKDIFMREAMVSVKYVSFPISQYLSDSNIEETVIQDYYYDNIESYSTNDTNNLSIPLPFNDVQEDIAELLKKDQAQESARNEAIKFVMTLTPGRYSKPPTFDKAAESFKLDITKTELFSLTDEVKGVNAGEDFNRIAFALDPEDADRYFSDTIDGDDAVYVLCADEKIESRVPDFKEVRSEVIALAETDAQKTAFDEEVLKIRESIAAAMKDGKSFSDAAKKQGLEITVSEPVSLYGDASTNEFEYSTEILSGIASIKDGEVSDLINIEEGVLLASIAERTPGDLMSMQMLKPQLLQVLTQYNSSLLYDAWSDYILKTSGFEDYKPIPQLDEEDETDQEEI